MLNNNLKRFTELHAYAEKAVKSILGPNFKLHHFIPTCQKKRIWTIVVVKVGEHDYVSNKTFRTVMNAGFHKPYHVVDDADTTFNNSCAALQELIDHLESIPAKDLSKFLKLVGISVQRIALIKQKQLAAS
jgi:hypothetical protein